MLPTYADVVVVGAGLAGAATAYHLRARGVTDVIILERAAAPGLASSGRNAAILRTAISQAPLAAWAQESATSLDTLHVVRRTGGYLVGQGDTRVPKGLAAAGAEAALQPTDGVVDVPALLRIYLGDTRVFAGVTVERLSHTAEHVEVATPAGHVRAKFVVNAAGAWAGVLGGIDVKPTSRHVYITPPDPNARDDHPWVWDLKASWYVRPYEGAWMMSPCDERPAEPGDDQLHAAMEAEALATWHRIKPATAPAHFAIRWVGQRTFAPDRLPVVGVDANHPRLVHVAGLGGHGVTLSWLLGQRAAALLPLASLERLDAL